MHCSCLQKIHVLGLKCQEVLGKIWVKAQYKRHLQLWRRALINLTLQLDFLRNKSNGCQDWCAHTSNFAWGPQGGQINKRQQKKGWLEDWHAERLVNVCFWWCKAHTFVKMVSAATDNRTVHEASTRKLPLVYAVLLSACCCSCSFLLGFSLNRLRMCRRVA